MQKSNPCEVVCLLNNLFLSLKENNLNEELLISLKAFTLHGNAACPEESDAAPSLLYTDQHWTGRLLSNSHFWTLWPQQEASVLLSIQAVFIQIQYNWTEGLGIYIKTDVQMKLQKVECKNIKTYYFKLMRKNTVSICAIVVCLK